MFGVLLESRARRQRRGGGAALSVATHLAIVAFITITTVRIAPARPQRVVPTAVHFATAKTVSPSVAHLVTDRVSDVPVFRLSPLAHIDVPRTIPTSLPSTELSPITVSNEVDFGRSGDSHGPVGPRGILEGERPSSTEWRGNELLMRIVSTAKPRYPESLRQIGIEGTVLVRFTVDTTGRVDAKSATIISSTNILFSRAVLDALDGFRFKPAEVGNHRVAALAEMPFEFRISK